MPRGVPANFLYIKEACNRFIILGEGNHQYGEAMYRRLYDDLVANWEEWIVVSLLPEINLVSRAQFLPTSSTLQFFSHPLNQSHAGDTCMVLEKLCDIYDLREDYEECSE